MIRMTEPDYKHYTRLETICADEAQWLLAVFELRNKEFSDKDTYEAQFADQYKLAARVLCHAFKKRLKPIYDDPDAVSYENGVINGYVFSLISINVVSFCTWALELKYNLPDVLVALVKGSDCNILSEEHGDQIAEDTQQLDESEKIVELPVTEEVPVEDTTETEVPMGEAESSETAIAIDSNDSSNTGEPKESEINNNDDENNKTNSSSVQKTSQNKRRKGGPKKCTLSLAVEIAYLKLLDQGETKVLRPKMKDAFMECFREMATDGNRNSDQGVLELIKEVRKSKLGKYTIVTHDRANKSNPLKIEEKSSECDASRVTRFLNTLRTNHPLPM